MIEVQNLSFSYPGASSKVFDGFQLKLESGHTYGFLGRNGTGKSTLLYLASGLLRPKKGHLYIDGMESAQRDPLMLSRIFLVPEEFSLPEMSLQKYVSLIRPFYPRFNEQVLNDCLSAFELPDVRDLRQLSMGQKKKVFMSVALAAGTEWLLMDEPTNGLDIPSKATFRQVVAKNLSDDTTLIISTHQVHDVEQLIDHVVILDQSRLLCDASVGEITQRYQRDEQRRALCRTISPRQQRDRPPCSQRAGDTTQLGDVLLGRHLRQDSNVNCRTQQKKQYDPVQYTAHEAIRPMAACHSSCHPAKDYGRSHIRIHPHVPLRQVCLP